MKAYFYTSTAYVVMAGFLWLMAINLWMLLNLLVQGPASSGLLRLLFGESVFFWLAMVTVVPVITMRLVAGERRIGTLETLLTAPVSDVMVVAAKYVAALTMFGLVWAPTIIYAFLLAGEDGGFMVDKGTIWASYLGIGFIGAGFVSVGLLSSSITRSQSEAAMLTAVVLAAFCFWGYFAPYHARSLGLQELGRYTSPVFHMTEFARGVVDTRALVFHLSITWLVLFVVVKVIESRHWRL